MEAEGAKKNSPGVFTVYCTVSANNLLKKLKRDLFETKKIINFISNFFLKEAPQKPREHHSRQVEDGEGGGGKGGGGDRTHTEPRLADRQTDSAICPLCE